MDLYYVFFLIDIRQNNLSVHFSLTHPEGFLEYFKKIFYVNPDLNVNPNVFLRKFCGFVFNTQKGFGRNRVLSVVQRNIFFSEALANTHRTCFNFSET